MIKIYKYGEVSSEEIFARDNPTANVEGVVSDIINNVRKNGVLDSALDGLGIGLGFTCSLTLIGAVRELLGSGAIFGQSLISGDGMLIFVLAPGGFLVLGYLMVLFNKLTAKNLQLWKSQNQFAPSLPKLARSAKPRKTHQPQPK